MVIEACAEGRSWGKAFRQDLLSELVRSEAPYPNQWKIAQCIAPRASSKVDHWRIFWRIMSIAICKAVTKGVHELLDHRLGVPDSPPMLTEYLAKKIVTQEERLNDWTFYQNSQDRVLCLQDVLLDDTADAGGRLSVSAKFILDQLIRRENDVYALGMAVEDTQEELEADDPAPVKFDV
jgi:hypothetical protein